MKQVLIIFAFFSALMVNAQPDPIGNFNKHVIEKWTHEYIRVSQYRVKGSPYLLGDSSKANKVLNWYPKTNLKELANLMYKEDINKYHDFSNRI